AEHRRSGHDSGDRDRAVRDSLPRPGFDAGFEVHPRAEKARAGFRVDDRDVHRRDESFEIPSPQRKRDLGRPARDRNAGEHATVDDEIRDRGWWLRELEHAAVLWG